MTLSFGIGEEISSMDKWKSYDPVLLKWERKYLSRTSGNLMTPSFKIEEEISFMDKFMWVINILLPSLQKTFRNQFSACLTQILLFLSMIFIIITNQQGQMIIHIVKFKISFVFFLNATLWEDRKKYFLKSELKTIRIYLKN